MAIWKGAVEIMGMNKSFWNSKRVLITGHTGFKGSWLTLWLRSLGANVIGYALPPPTEPSIFKLASINDDIINVIGDIRNYSELKMAITKYKPEIIFHLAAQPLVRQSYVNPIDTYSINVMGTVNLFETVRQTPGVKVVVNVTTDKCYENREWYWGYREVDNLGGYDPYSNSKGCSELVSSAFRSSYFHPDNYGEHGVALATARAGNVIGGGDWAKDRLIPDILSGFEKKQKVIIRNPNAIRPWQHVMEPLSGYLKLAQLLYDYGPTFAEPWNFGPNDEDCKSVLWIVKYMASVWGDVSWELDNKYNVHEANFLKLDISKAKYRLGWYPKLNITDALNLTIEWKKHQSRGGDIRALILEQVNAYMSLAET